MTGFLYKEIKLNWKRMLGFFSAMMIYPVVIAVLCITNSEDIMQEPKYSLDYMLFGIGAFMTFIPGGGFENSLFKDGENKKWAYFVTSTPSGIKGHIGAKYLLTLIFSMLTVTMLVLCNGLAMEGEGKVRDASVIYIALFYVQLLMRAIEFPLMARFGGKTGNNMKGALLVVTAYIVFVYVLFGDTSAFSDMPDFWETIFKTLADQEKMKKIMMCFSIATVSIIPLYYCSYRLAVKWYLKGVETYEK